MRSAASRSAAAALAAACQSVGGDRYSAITASATLPSPSDTVLSLAPMLDRVTPSVVNLSVEVVTEAELPPVLQDPQVRRFFGIPDELPEQREISVGSGVIIDSGRGLVVTNHHVVAGADRIVVTLKDGRELDGRFVNGDPQTDIAVLRIDASGLTALPFADSEQVRVGDLCLRHRQPLRPGSVCHHRHCQRPGPRRPDPRRL